jgi:hypothetical protein
MATLVPGYCKRCQEVTDHYRHAGKNGPFEYCRPCHLERMAAWYERNREKRLKQMAAYHQSLRSGSLKFDSNAASIAL